MPTASEAAAGEAHGWDRLAQRWQRDARPHVWDDVAGSEAAVVSFYDPAPDLTRRAAVWGFEFAANDLADVCRFAAALAATEASAWETDEPHIATRARSNRRFLVGDRILHWAVPWLDAVARCHPDEREEAEAALSWLLDVGDALRPAPQLAGGSEGLALPGEDSYGPRRPKAPLPQYLLSVWSGRVIMAATLTSMGNDAGRSLTDEWIAAHSVDLATMYGASAARWRRLSQERPGSSRLWIDLAGRAEATAERLRL